MCVKRRHLLRFAVLLSFGRKHWEGCAELRRPVTGSHPCLCADHRGAVQLRAVVSTGPFCSYAALHCRRARIPATVATKQSRSELSQLNEITC